MSNFGGQYIYQDNDFGDAEYNRICSNQMDVTIKSFLFKMPIIIFSTYTACYGPIRDYILDGIITSTVQVPENLLINFLFHFQFIVILHGGLVYVGAEVWMALVENTVNILPILFKLEMKRFCEQFKIRSMYDLEMHLGFRNLVKQSLDADT